MGYHGIPECVGEGNWNEAEPMGNAENDVGIEMKLNILVTHYI